MNKMQAILLEEKGNNELRLSSEMPLWYFLPEVLSK